MYGGLSGLPNPGRARCPATHICITLNYFLLAEHPGACCAVLCCCAVLPSHEPTSSVPRCCSQWTTAWAPLRGWSGPSTLSRVMHRALHATTSAAEEGADRVGPALPLRDITIPDFDLVTAQPSRGIWSKNAHFT